MSCFSIGFFATSLCPVRSETTLKRQRNGKETNRASCSDRPKSTLVMTSTTRMLTLSRSLKATGFQRYHRCHSKLTEDLKHATCHSELLAFFTYVVEYDSWSDPPLIQLNHNCERFRAASSSCTQELRDMMVGPVDLEARRPPGCFGCPRLTTSKIYSCNLVVFSVAAI